MPGYDGPRVGGFCSVSGTVANPAVAWWRGGGSGEGLIGWLVGNFQVMTLSTQRDFREVQNLPFCYICGTDFAVDDDKDRDHVPAKGVFNKEDRTPNLWLLTHRRCNAAHSTVDHKIGELIGLKYGRFPIREHAQLRLHEIREEVTGIVNLDINDAIWSWVRGFHAAIYRAPLPATGFPSALVTPFPSAAYAERDVRFDRIPQQHRAFVETIKIQRAKGNLDSINSNNGKLIYECVWEQAADNGPWRCVFALNFYDWKDMGRIPGAPARGCAGFYAHPSGQPPIGATRRLPTPILVPNIDQLDPFGP